MQDGPATQLLAGVSSAEHSEPVPRIAGGPVPHHVEPHMSATHEPRPTPSHTPRPENSTVGQLSLLPVGPKTPRFRGGVSPGGGGATRRPQCLPSFASRRHLLRGRRPCEIRLPIPRRDVLSVRRQVQAVSSRRVRASRHEVPVDPELESDASTLRRRTVH